MIRRIKILIISIVIIGAIFIGTKVYATTGKVINNSTRIREDKSTSSSIVETIDNKETEVEIIEEDGEWYKVKYKNYEGYIRKDLLEVEGNADGDSSEAKEDSKEDSADTNKDNDNKEENNNTETKQENTESQPKAEENSKKTVSEKMEAKISNKVEVKILPLVFANNSTTIEKYNQIKVLEILGNWCHIESNEKEGWVLKSKLEEIINQEENVEEDSEKSEEQNNTENNTEDETENEDNSTKEETEEKEEEKKEEQETKKVNKTKYVSTSILNVREDAKSNAKVIDQLDQNDKVTVTEEIGTWSKITKSGKTGYVASEYLSDEKTEVSSRASQETRGEANDNDEENNETNNENNDSKEEQEENTSNTTEKEETKKEETKKEEPKKEETKKVETKKEEKEEEEESNSKVTGSDIIAYAKKFLGYKYVYGTAGPNTFDCSGFTSYVYKHFGYSLNRTSSGQRSNGKSVSKDSLKAGDIVCFSGHVGLYIGDGKFIHAANPSKGVIISSLSESYYKKNYITARRIL